MQISKGGWVHRLLVDSKDKQTILQRDLELYKVALENAYEGIVISDANGTILTVSQTYASFLKTSISDMLGKHVTEVIPNTRLHIVAKTGKAEIADLQQIHGHWMIASRIPIRSEGELIAVVGKIMFQDIDKLFVMNSKYREIKDHLHYAEGKEYESPGVKYSFNHIIGESESIEKLKLLAYKVAKSSSTVVLSGESGTGKELFAHAIHRESGRRLGPFVPVNCAAIPEALFESELFGYKEGSFTGAKRTGKKGKFALAHKGTIFLDEVSEIPLTQQVKLLRVLQEKELEPVGGDRPEAIDVRVIAATNRDLRKLMLEGKFRQDLYYRLNVVAIMIPPLRERQNDIPVILNDLLRQLREETGIQADGIEAEAEKLLIAYSWPGNVREMRNVLERALYVMDGTWIGKADLPAELWEDSSKHNRRDNSLKEQLESFEEQLIREKLVHTNGDKQETARQLGISRSSLYQKLEKYEGIINKPV
ncbi:sigma-54 interaction domain-containing protein [Paenibacillus eucommiae]|uniref:PAS domain S-box-containing protein n=1 Tax=Paenibacillus eucommiae TaxID=1355755 RepID=A0ABS4J2I7_9BACL|nr:sigma 54-interacting transcriptional regulator [Paenibacillus eucommiae]MBP1994037.1 PAS domain S-box-containing protein [Paenibacillus eucommiae]